MSARTGRAQPLSVIALILGREPSGLSCDELAKQLHRRRADVLAWLEHDDQYERCGAGSASRWRLADRRGRIRDGQGEAEPSRLEPGSFGHPDQRERGGERVNHEPLVDANVIAELLAVPVTWVLEHARSETIPHYRLGRYVRFRVSEVLAWVEECRAGGRVTAFRRYTSSDQTTAPAPLTRPGA
jgi:excisionase family DNA binding protein